MNIRVLKIVFDKNVDKIEYATFLPSGLAVLQRIFHKTSKIVAKHVFEKNSVPQK